MKKIVFLVVFLTSLANQMTYAMFVNSGIMRSKKSTFSAAVFHNTGTIEGLDSVDLRCARLTGDGLIKGPKMEIFAVECDYRGVIDCSQECVLTTNTPESGLKFSFVGGGKLVIKKCQ